MNYERRRTAAIDQPAELLAQLSVLWDGTATDSGPMVDDVIRVFTARSVTTNHGGGCGGKEAATLPGTQIWVFKYADWMFIRHRSVPLRRAAEPVVVSLSAPVV